MTSDDVAVRTVPKALAEYPLPAAAQTHELAYVGNKMLVVTQQTDSVLVQLSLDPATGRPLAATGHVIGTSRSGLHGLYPAAAPNEGCVWATLQFDNRLLLVRPGADVDTPPQVLQEIDLPAPARGPHVVVAYGDELWTTCKDSSHVVRVNAADPSDASVYPCSRRPIFVARHPTSGYVYASLDRSSRILRIDLRDRTEETPIPADQGATPVGLVAGPDGNVWFVLLGGSGGGTGTFARIRADGAITWYRLTTATAANAGLIHLAWSAAGDGTPVLWLLASSISNPMVPNAVVRVTFQDDFGAIATQETFSLPTQMSMAHRVLPQGGSVYVTEMMASVLAHLPVAQAPLPAVDEASDYYADFGLGQPTARIVYADPYGSI